MGRIFNVLFGIGMVMVGIAFIRDLDPTIYFHILGFGMTKSVLAMMAIILGVYVLYIVIKTEFIDPIKREKEKQYKKLHNNNPII